jgi:hypothetical protein
VIDLLLAAFLLVVAHVALDGPAAGDEGEG